MPSAAEHVAAAIRAAGALRFDRYVELALYGPHGFYSGAGRAGRRGGDFITSPEVGPLFATVVARAVDAWWEELGRPDPFVVIDAGSGPGTLARALRSSLGASAAASEVIAVEVSPAQRALHHGSVTSRASLPEGPVDGIVIANELLDNLPFRLLVFDAGWREAYVDLDGDRFVESLRPLPVGAAANLGWLPASAPHGARIPWQQGASDWVDGARARLRRGRVVAIDYVTPRTAALAMRPWREWLRTYRGHERGAHYLAAVGEQDVTAEVALDQLAEPEAVRSQAQFLQRWGIDELVEEGRREWAAAAAAPTLAAMVMRSRVREAEALLDAHGLGRFTVLEWTERGGAPTQDA